MNINVREENQKLILEPTIDRLDGLVATDFKNGLVTHCQSGSKHIVIDLNLVSFIDSSGLGALVSAMKNKPEDGTILLANLRPSVMSVFKMTRLNRVFSIYDSTDEAVGA